MSALPQRCGDCGGEVERDGLGLLRAVAATPRPPQAAVPSPPTSTVTAADLMRRDFPEPRWAVPGVLPEGAVLLGGASKIGKSWLVLGLAVAVAAGGRALGQIPVEPGAVLYLALEDGPRRLQERLLALLDGEAAPDRLHLATKWPPLHEGGAAALDAWLGEHPDARLVIVDVLQRLRPPTTPTGSIYAADYGLMAAFKAVADEHKVTLLAVHHTRKLGADDPLDTLSGTNGLAAAVDTILVFSREVRQADGALYLRGRDVAEADHALRFDGPTGRWNLTGDAAKLKLTAGRAEVITLLERTGRPLAPKEIAEALGGSRGNVRVLLKRMSDRGQVQAGGDGTYHLHTLPPVTPVTPVTAVPGTDPPEARGETGGVTPPGAPDTRSAPPSVTVVAPVTGGERSRPACFACKATLGEDGICGTCHPPLAVIAARKLAQGVAN